MVLRYAGKRKIGNMSGDYYRVSGASFKRFKRGLNQVPKRYRGLARSSGFYGKFRGRSSRITQELKFLDTAVSFTADATAEIPATGQLNLVPQNDTQSGRDGRKIIIKSIQLHGKAVQVPGAGAQPNDILTMYVVQDTQCNGAAATVADDNTGIFTAAAADLSQAVRCLANTDRFRILKKFQMNFDEKAGATTAYPNMYKVINWYKKCNIPIEFDASATTGAITTIRSNNVFLVAGTATGSDDTISVIMTARIRFVG